MTAQQSAAEAAQRGATILDEHHPGWFREVDLDTLDITSCNYCVLGQLSGRGEQGGGFSEMLWSLMGERPTVDDDDDSYYERGDDFADRNGFDAWGGTDHDYADLTAAWKDLIEKRRAA